MALKYYLDYAEDDYKYLVSRYENSLFANSMGSTAQSICERYMKNLICEYDNPLTDEGVAIGIMY